MNRKKIDDAIRSNTIDKHALDMLDTLLCIHDLYSDVQTEVLRIKDEYDVPDGALGNICKFADEFCQYAEDMFVNCYDIAISDERLLMSDRVATMVFDEVYRIRYSRESVDC